MKKLFSILVLALSFSALSAQQTTVALLNHEGTISTFYGSEALVQAHKAAVHGDAITLSGGSFNAPSSWTKAVTLRGAGCYEGADNSREVTYINKTLDLAIPAEVETAVIMEGLSFKSSVSFSTAVKNTTFLKCYFAGEVSNIRGTTNFYNCIVAYNLGFYNTTSTIVNLFNCYVHNAQYSARDISAKFTNCVLKFSGTSTNSASAKLPSGLHNAKYHNCIFVGTIKVDNGNFNAADIPTDCTANNCLSCYSAYEPAVDTDVETKDAVYDYNIFDNISGGNNKYLENGTPVEEAIKSVFKTYNGTNDFSFNELYELTDEAKAKYLGSDGTQVGLYGGMGFDLVPSTLQITKCEVAPRSTKDGKLSVKIEVGIPE